MKVQSRGFQINYITSGEGEPLVLIPGLTQSINSWLRSGYVDAFSDAYRVIAVDPLGHGGSDKPHDPTSYLLRNVVEDVVAVLDAEGIRRAHVWGYSRGGTIACLVATDFPERVASLVSGGQHIAPLPEAIWNGVMETWHQQALPLLAGEWGDYLLTAYGAEMEALAKAENDPRATGAALEGQVLSGWLQYDLRPLRGRILTYGGSEEPFLKVPGALDILLADCEALGARSEVLPALTHAEAFRRRDVVEPLVREQLAGVRIGDET